MERKNKITIVFSRDEDDRGELGVKFDAHQLEHDLKVFCRIPIDSLEFSENEEVH